MLTPDYLLHISEGAEEIAELLHQDIIKRIIERIMIRVGRGDDYILTAQDKWQIETLQDAGHLLEDIQKEIAKKTKMQQKEIKEAMEDAGVRALQYDDAIYMAAGLSPSPLMQSPAMVRIMQRNYEATMGEWKNFTRTTANEAQKSFVRAVDKAYTLISSGAVSYTQAVREAIEEMAADGVEVHYPTGHKDTIETATLRAVRTGIGQMSAQITDARMEEMDWEIILVSSHLGARVTAANDFTNHSWWQGKFYSRTGKDDRFPPYSVCGFGHVQGIHGANCRHSHGPGDGEHNPFEQYDSEENRKAYELQQRQRALERRIRKTKREVMALKAAADNAGDEKLKFELDMAYQKRAALLRKQNEAYSDFCEENDLKRLSDRLQVARWDRQQAAKARGAAQGYEDTKDKSPILSDTTDKWSREARRELLQSEKSIGDRAKETMEIYNSKGEYIMSKRGTSDSVRLSVLNYRKLKNAVVTHNHPSGGSFSFTDWRFIKEMPISELRVAVDEGVYYIRKPQKWPAEIKSLEKMETVFKEIRKSLQPKYVELYNKKRITKVERHKMLTNEINQIFAERYGIEYGFEPYE